MPEQETTRTESLQEVIQDRDNLVISKPELAESFAAFRSSFERFRKSQDQLKGKGKSASQKPSMRLRA